MGLGMVFRGCCVPSGHFLPLPCIYYAPIRRSERHWAAAWETRDPVFSLSAQCHSALHAPRPGASSCRGCSPGPVHTADVTHMSHGCVGERSVRWVWGPFMGHRKAPGSVGVVAPDPPPSRAPPPHAPGEQQVLPMGGGGGARVRHATARAGVAQARGAMERMKVAAASDWSVGSSPPDLCCGQDRSPAVQPPSLTHATDII